MAHSRAFACPVLLELQGAQCGSTEVWRTQRPHITVWRQAKRQLFAGKKLMPEIICIRHSVQATACLEGKMSNRPWCCVRLNIGLACFKEKTSWTDKLIAMRIKISSGSWLMRSLPECAFDMGVAKQEQVQVHARAWVQWLLLRSHAFPI